MDPQVAHSGAMVCSAPATARTSMEAATARMVPSAHGFLSLYSSVSGRPRDSEPVELTKISLQLEPAKENSNGSLTLQLRTIGCSRLPRAKGGLTKSASPSASP